MTTINIDPDDGWVVPTWNAANLGDGLRKKLIRNGDLYMLGGRAAETGKDPIIKEVYFDEPTGYWYRFDPTKTSYDTFLLKADEEQTSGFTSQKLARGGGFTIEEQAEFYARAKQEWVDKNKRVQDALDGYEPEIPEEAVQDYRDTIADLEEALTMVRSELAARQAELDLINVELETGKSAYDRLVDTLFTAMDASSSLSELEGRLEDVGVNRPREQVLFEIDLPSKVKEALVAEFTSWAEEHNIKITSVT